MTPEEIAEVAKLNDDFRKSCQGTVMTPGVLALDDVFELAQKVIEFDEFTEDNDPYGEHDFGSFKWEGQTIFWKISYYDQTYKYGEDPLSPKCKRVMTIMLASEY